MAVSEYETYGVAKIKSKHQSKSHVGVADRNKVALKACFTCGAKAKQGWSHLGIFVMCTELGCLTQFHSQKKLSAVELAAKWNSVDREPPK
jgi:hypothetical protein